MPITAYGLDPTIPRGTGAGALNPTFFPISPEPWGLYSSS